MATFFRRPASAMGAMATRMMQQNAMSYSSILHGAKHNTWRPNVAHPINYLCRNSVRSFSSKETVTITYIDPTGEEHPVEAEVGKHLLDVAHDNNIELEGACGGELACSTCHLVFDQDVYDTLPEKSDEEEDMLDLAFELTETSRLGCQICVTKEFDGVKVRIPDDGY